MPDSASSGLFVRLMPSVHWAVIPLIPSNPNPVLMDVWPTTPVMTTMAETPAGSEMTAAETTVPSGKTIVPKSPMTGAEPSSVSIFSLQVSVSLSMRPSGVPVSSI